MFSYYSLMSLEENQENAGTIADIKKELITIFKFSPELDDKATEMKYDIKFLLALLEMDAKEESSLICSHPLLDFTDPSINKLIALYLSAKSNKAKKNIPVFEDTSPSGGAKNTHRSTPDSSKAFEERQTVPLKDEKKEGMNKSAEGKGAKNVKRLAIFSRTRDRSQLTYEPHKRFHHFFEDLIEYKPEIKDKGAKFVFNLKSTNDRDNVASYSLKEALHNYRGVETHPDDGSSLSLSKEESLAAYHLYKVPEDGVAVQILLEASQEFAEGAFHTVKEVVMTLLGGLQDAAVFTIAQVIHLKSPRNAVLSFHSLTESLADFVKRNSQWYLIYSRANYSIQHIAGGVRMVHNRFTWKKWNTLNDIFFG